MEFLNLTSDCLVLAISLGKIWNAVSVVLGLGLVIFFHELGHFAVAKWCDVHVERFSIGIGPIIWSRQKGETEYALSALPFGGYVKMLGQDDMDATQMTSDEIAENARSYSSKKVWQRMAIISAGVIMNVITGFLFFTIAYRFGVVETVPMIGQVTAGSPAWQAGIESGSTITKVNGDEINSFKDFREAIVLSKGAVTLEGTTADGSELYETVTPDKGQLRTIGIGPASKATISPNIPDDISIEIPSLPAAGVETKFQPGDKVLTVNGEAVNYLHELSYVTARNADKDLIFQIERPTGEAGESESGTTATESVEIIVPPRQMKSIGLRMAIGPVSLLREGSIADEAGLKVDDQIIRVNDLEISKDLDPLRLPNYFAENAGQEVAVVVRRTTEDDGSEEVELTITPADEPGWWKHPDDVTEALQIPAIGAGIHVQPRIAQVVEGTEAAGEDAAFEPGQKITKVELLAPEEGQAADGLGEETLTIDLEADSAEDGTPNWAHVHWRMQAAPERKVKIYIGQSANTKEEFTTTLLDKDSIESWYLPIRGIRGWQYHSRVRKTASWPEAFALGFKETKSSAFKIYLTLQSLFAGRLSMKSFSGPLGILSIGYQIAESGITKLLNFLGFLSINLAILNFLPIPVLDGGHMVFLIWEAVARRKPSPKVINFATQIGFLFIISLFVFVLYLDIFVNKLGFGG